MANHPHISFIIAARNGEHDNSFLMRLRTVLRLRNAFVARHKLSCEFIIVQYNPPESQPLLEESLTDLVSDAMPIRVFTVPESFHARIAPGRKGPFLEYVAKNIGIRRAHGEFILSTNLDIVYSDEMIARLAQPLEQNVVYQARCHDLNIREIADSVDPDIALQMCRNHVDRIWTEYGLLYVSWSRWLRRLLNHRRPLSFIRNLAMCPLYNPIKKLLPTQPIKDVAPGHFTLAHRDAWAKVRGYDQRQLIGSYLDSYAIGIFACHGFKQVVLPEPIYHIKHNINPLLREPMGVEKFKQDMKMMAVTGTPYAIYPEDWGFPEEQFSEQRIIFGKK